VTGAVVERLDAVEQRARNSARDDQCRRWWSQASSRLSVAQNASIAALSWASPVDPKDATGPMVLEMIRESQRRADTGFNRWYSTACCSESRRSLNASAGFFQPSVLRLPGWRRPTAITSALIAEWVVARSFH
jgi:hypothetical protein